MKTKLLLTSLIISELPNATDIFFPRPVIVAITANSSTNIFCKTLVILFLLPHPPILLINDSYNVITILDTKNKNVI